LDALTNLLDRNNLHASHRVPAPLRAIVTRSTISVRQVNCVPRAMNFTDTDFRKAMGTFATGVTIITVDQEGEIHGMTANAFTSVSLDPPLILVCVDHRARTHAHLHARKRFGVNVLSSSQQAISEYYAQSAETHQHPENVGARFERTAHGTPILHGALAYLECRLHSTQAAGDHTIFIAEVEDVEVREGEPLLYFRSQYRGSGEGKG
jgi:flavin reductase